MILLTGASGFIGGAVLQALKECAISVRPIYRKNVDHSDSVIIETLDKNTDWTHALNNVDVVIHCAARTHIMNDEAIDSMKEYYKINVDGSLQLARQAAEAGVRRFIFISSIKVNGESTKIGQKYSASDLPAPEDAYGISKAEAEKKLFELAQKTKMELVIIRPVMVYGPNVKGNFQTMMQWIARGIPLPLGSAIKNRRSLVALDNLVNLICICINHPQAVNQVFLISDDEDLSTAAILRRLGRAVGRDVRLLPVPVFLLNFGARLIGKSRIANRLLGSLQVDIKKTRNLLGWTPPLTTDEGFKKLTRHKS